MEKSRTYTKMKNNLLSKTKILMGIFFIVLLFAACNNKTEQNSDTKADTTEKTNVKAAAASTEFDVVMLNGRVMDPETNFDKVQNVGILDGKIAIITDKEIKGKELIVVGAIYKKKEKKLLMLRDMWCHQVLLIHMYM